MANPDYDNSEWHSKSAKIKQQRGRKCQKCGSSSNLTVHHGYYRPETRLWEYEDESLWCLCWPCHKKTQSWIIECHRLLGFLQPAKCEEIFGIISEALDEPLRERFFGQFLAGKCGSLPTIPNDIRDHWMNQNQPDYSEYGVTILSTSDVGESHAEQLIQALETLFPGINANSQDDDSSPDCICTVDGPDNKIVAIIQDSCNTLREEMGV